MSIPLVKKVRQAVHRHGMLEKGDSVVAAVSGGPDSVALLLILRQLSVAYRLRLIVAHLNHGLVGGPADEGEAFVRKLSIRLDLICEAKKVDIASLSRAAKKSIEETAREERYRFLEEVRRKHRAGKIALGHHAQDQAETVLMHLLRGSGRQGLRGMQPIREERYIRPLLGVTRKEILNYLEEQHEPYLTDRSNEDGHYLRNRVRHRLIPVLKADYNENLEEHLCRTADIFRLEDDYLQGVVESLADDSQLLEKDIHRHEVRIAIPAFFDLHEALQARLIKHLLLANAPGRQGIGYVHIQDVISLMMNRHPSGVVHLPFGMEARREYDVLMIGRRQVALRPSVKETGKPEVLPRRHFENTVEDHAVHVPGVIRMEEQKKLLAFDIIDSADVRFGESGTIYLNYDAVIAPLRVRAMQPGDRIQPLGMTGMKKLKKVFIDKKIPLCARSGIPVLVDSHAVICIMGHMVSERVKITDRTANILRIRMTEMI